eukprot:COSAG01_NODE_699_length_14176_cov_21.100590_7_plen_105_part_00
MTSARGGTLGGAQKLAFDADDDDSDDDYGGPGGALTAATDYYTLDGRLPTASHDTPGWVHDELAATRDRLAEAQRLSRVWAERGEIPRLESQLASLQQALETER